MAECGWGATGPPRGRRKQARSQPTPSPQKCLAKVSQNYPQMNQKGTQKPDQDDAQHIIQRSQNLSKT